MQFFSISGTDQDCVSCLLSLKYQPVSRTASECDNEPQEFSKPSVTLAASQHLPREPATMTLKNPSGRKPSIDLTPSNSNRPLYVNNLRNRRNDNGNGNGDGNGYPLHASVAGRQRHVHVPPSIGHSRAHMSASHTSPNHRQRNLKNNYVHDPPSRHPTHHQQHRPKPKTNHRLHTHTRHFAEPSKDDMIKLLGDSQLVDVEDRQFIPDYIFLAMAQLEPCLVTEKDRIGTYKTRDVGFKGMSCKHCGGEPGFGRYFPETVRSLSQTTTSQTIVKHIAYKCHKCPAEIREKVKFLKEQQDMKDKAAKENRRSRFVERPKYGSRKVFFQRLWGRLHEDATVPGTETDTDPSTDGGGDELEPEMKSIAPTSHLQKDGMHPHSKKRPSRSRSVSIAGVDITQERKKKRRSVSPENHDDGGGNDVAIASSSLPSLGLSSRGEGSSTLSRASRGGKRQRVLSL